MDSRIMQVFYGNDCLPYKDKERTVHYPITGSCFQGAQNTTQIRFYFERIGNSNTTWVAVSKLPNGKLGSKVLETHSDTDVGEYYAQLDLSAFYTQHRGDVFISLQGYQGGVQVEYDSEEEIYEIVGTPTIQATGSIKLSINYAPMFVADNEEELEDLQSIASVLGTKLNIINGVYVISNIQSVIDSPSNYEDGQLFYCETNKQYYQLSSGNVIVYDSGILGSKNALIRYNFNSTDTLASLRDLENKVFILRYSGKDYLASVELYVNDINVAMLDLSQQKLLYFNGLGTDTFEYMFANAQTIKYVERTLANNKVYATNGSGNPTTLDYSTQPSATNLVQRDANAQIKVPETPLSNNDATSKKYVDDKVKEFAQNEMQKVDTTTYPTLQDFLESDGEEGIIYLYPIDTTDLTKGFYRYIWEDNEWLSLGTTEIDLSDYYTKSETNSLLDGKVDKTSSSKKVYATDNFGNQTTLDYGADASGNKIVQRDSNGFINVPNDIGTQMQRAVNGAYVFNQIYQVTTLINQRVSKTSDANKVYITGDTGNQEVASYDDYATGSFVRRNDSGGQIYVPATPTANTHASSKKYVDDGLATKQDALVSGTNIKTLNGTSLLGSGNYTFDSELNDISTNAVQNKVLKGELDSVKAELTQLKLEFYESVVDIKTKAYTYLSFDIIPFDIDTQPIIYSAGTDIVEIKGNSVVVNQKVNYLGLETNTINDVTFTNNTNGTFSLNGTASATAGFELISTSGQLFPIGHKILILGQTGDSDCYIQGYSSSIGAFANENTRIFTMPDTQGTYTYLRIRVSSGKNTNGVKIDVRVVDLTQWFNGNIPQDLLDNPSLFITKYWLGDLPYDQGHIENSKPTNLITLGLNQWDEDWELGNIDPSTGAKINANDVIRSKNYIGVKPNTTYYFKSSSGIFVYEYDENYNFVNAIGGTTNTTKTTSSNTRYLLFRTPSAYGTTYKYDICINVSNASVNGTYKPYVKHEYPLTIPTLRSAGSVQDTTKKVNVGFVDLGSLTWGKYNNTFYADVPTIKRPSASNVVGNLTCDKYLPTTVSNVTNEIEQGIASNNGSSRVNIYDVSLASSTPEQFKSAMSGVILNFELATPTDQPSITLPEDIAIEKGGTIQVEYDANNETPSDFDFEFATNKAIGE